MDTCLDFSNLASSREAGVNSQALEAINTLFDEQISCGLHPAAQLVVLKDGHLIIDRAAGVEQGRPITADTPFYTFSVSKAFTGICVHKLIEENKVSLDAPVAEYWPAFGKKGKQTTTIRHVFLHLAGIPARGFYRQVPLWPFWGLLANSIANLTPEYEPGSKNAYHLVNYGFIFGEVVRRVSGKSIDVYFDTHFARPLGMRNSWLKIPNSELHRSPHIYSGIKDQDNVARAFNLPVIRRSLIPAASLHSTSRDIAVFYHMLVSGGQYAGTRYLKPETIQQATALGYQGWDFLVQREVRLAYGFHLGGLEPPAGSVGPIYGAASTERTFGHVGNRSCMAWADHASKLVVAFTCNRLLSHEETRARWFAISNAVWALLDN